MSLTYTEVRLAACPVPLWRWRCRRVSNYPAWQVWYRQGRDPAMLPGHRHAVDSAGESRMLACGRLGRGAQHAGLRLNDGLWRVAMEISRDLDVGLVIWPTWDCAATCRVKGMPAWADAGVGTAGPPGFGSSRDGLMSAGRDGSCRSSGLSHVGPPTLEECRPGRSGKNACGA